MVGSEDNAGAHCRKHLIRRLYCANGCLPTAETQVGLDDLLDRKDLWTSQVWHAPRRPSFEQGNQPIGHLPYVNRLEPQSCGN
jgi:hypothetical protein